MKHLLPTIQSIHTTKAGHKKALYLPFLLIITAAFLVLTLGLVQLSTLQRKSARINQTHVSALGVAEAGISYYLWHLAHNNTDYADGHTPPASSPYGPYVHNYTDTNGTVIGTYSITITPPPNGSTIATVTATGTLNGSTKPRTVKALLGIPSFSQYSIVTASEVWFGATESTNGPVHSNVGVHFDGTNNGVVSAANATYVPTVPFGGNGNTVHNGVWGTGGPQSQWIFPVPTVDFNKVAADLSGIKTQAIANGKYLAKSPNLGYFIQFQNDGTYKLATVTGYTFAALTTTALVSQPIPANGIIFAEDNVWVEGTVKGRYTVAAATLPASGATNRDITVTNNLLYTVKDGSDALGLVAQRDVKVGPNSPNIFEIDAAMLSQTARVYRPCRWNDASPCFQGNGSPKSDTYNLRDTITVYGSIGCFSYWNWSWIAGISGTIKSGYVNTIQTYDDHMLFSPPPSFPTTGKYALLSWREILSP